MNTLHRLGLGMPELMIIFVFALISFVRRTFTK